ncbi:MAG: helix-turn-helix domain-containing protein [Bacteroidaceae bacterium]|nr:helix-turn-helix domain-containing protein [Bacteroidaceae bacterium]
MRKFTVKDKKKVLDLLHDGMTKNALARLLGIERKRITIWELRYKEKGIEGLEPPARRRYTQAFQRQLVREHLRNKTSMCELCAKYNISLSSVKNWVHKHRDQV